MRMASNSPVSGVMLSILSLRWLARASFSLPKHSNSRSNDRQVSSIVLLLSARVFWFTHPTCGRGRRDTSSVSSWDLVAFEHLQQRILHLEEKLRPVGLLGADGPAECVIVSPQVLGARHQG